MYSVQQSLRFGFLQHYPLKKIGLFFILSNTGLCSLLLMYHSYIVHTRKGSSKFDDLQMHINHAIATVNAHSMGPQDQQLTQLQDEFKFDESRITSSNLLKAIDLNRAPQTMSKEIELVRPVLGQDNLKIYHKNGKVQAVSKFDKNDKLLRTVFLFENAVYDKSGTRLDKVETMLKPMSVVTQTGKQKLRISSGYGMRVHPILKTNLFHAGIDIAAAKNSPISAALDGTVKVIAYNRGYGTYIILKHRNNLETLYGHMDSVNSKLAIGKKVRQGEAIGKVGKTGRATSYHLHFETRIKGKHVNPASIKPMAYKLEGKKLKNFQEQAEETLADIRLLDI